MGAWKTSDGGSISVLGSSSSSLTAAGTLISAAANTKGVTIRTCVLQPTTGTFVGQVMAGGIAISAYTGGGGASISDREIFIPAGVAVTYAVTAGAGIASVSYDIH